MTKEDFSGFLQELTSIGEGAVSVGLSDVVNGFQSVLIVINSGSSKFNTYIMLVDDKELPVCQRRWCFKSLVELQDSPTCWRAYRFMQGKLALGAFETRSDWEDYWKKFIGNES